MKALKKNAEYAAIQSIDEFFEPEEGGDQACDNSKDESLSPGFNVDESELPFWCNKLTIFAVISTKINI